MRRPARNAFLVLCATALSTMPAAPEARPLAPWADRLCDSCLDVCALPLSHEDALLDQATDSYGAAASRAAATAAAIAMAQELRRVRLDHGGGHFPAAYEDHERAIESLAGKQAASDRATSAEIRALKRVRTALYADTVAALQALVSDPPSEEFLTAYRADQAVLEGVLASLSSPQRMRAAERRAVCRVLAHVPRADRPSSERATDPVASPADRPPD